MAPLPRTLSGRTPAQVRSELRLAAQARVAACRLKLAVLRSRTIDLPGPRQWPPIADLPTSVARGYATDAEVAMVMAMVAEGSVQRLSDRYWQARATELYTLLIAFEHREDAGPDQVPLHA